MERIAVESSNMESIWYDKWRMILEIEFSNNSIYQYLNVPEKKYYEIMGADSHWKYLNSDIKGIYDFIQIL